eukprot:892656-Prymnesium_polylepis.1
MRLPGWRAWRWGMRRTKAWRARGACARAWRACVRACGVSACTRCGHTYAYVPGGAGHCRVRAMRVCAVVRARAE